MASSTYLQLPDKLAHRVGAAQDAANTQRISIPRNLTVAIDLDPAFTLSPDFHGHLPQPFNELGATVTRADLFQQGGKLHAASSEKELLSFLYLVNAWGYGTAGYGLSRTNKVATNTEWNSFVESARAAISILRSNPPDNAAVCAYYFLNNKAQGRVKWWGPAFFTKFLAFTDVASTTAQGDRVPALILDRWMAEAVRKLTGKDERQFPDGQWTTAQYAHYLTLMDRLSRQHPFTNAPIRGDHLSIERCLFAHYGR